ncbi:MAG TPA: hypothetical protein VGP76_09890 [Planctomycetaceae bacterium]|jgi:hypothetical protein|nr:hypothetical protein [Planctomycetaceae bacterium]
MKTNKTGSIVDLAPAVDLAGLPWKPGQKHLQTVEHSLVVIRETANRFSSNSRHAAENSALAEVAIN